MRQRKLRGLGWWLLGPGLTGAVVAGACAQPKGALMLAVNTDMRAPKDVNAVSVTISTNGAIKHSFIGRVTPQGEVLLPATLAVVEPDDPSATIRIRVMAFQDHKPRVLRDVRTTIPQDGRTALLRIPLNFINDNSAVGAPLPAQNVLPDPAPGTSGTAPRGIGIRSAGDFDFFGAFQPPCPDIENQTIIDGECKDSFVDSSTLPDLDTAVLGDSTVDGSCFELARCFAGASSVGESGTGGGTIDAGPSAPGPSGEDGGSGAPALPGDGGSEFKDFGLRPGAITFDRTACTLQLNGADPARLNVALVTPDTGECIRPGECLVPIDRGAAGWQEENGRVQLPISVCKLLTSKNLRLATSADVCAAKEVSNPICTPKPGELPSPVADASLPDASLPDASLPDASVPLGVTVTVLDGVAPKANVRVIYQDAAGAVTGQAVTDAKGTVKVAAAPSMVTVLATGDNAAPAPVTFMGVTDGDNLTVATPGLSQGAPAGTYDVSFVQGGVIATADFLSVSAGFGCTGSGANPAFSVPVSLFSYCLGPQNAVLTEAFSGGPLLGFGFAKGVLPPVGLATVPVGPLSFTAPGTTKVIATNVPSGGGFSSNASLFAIANEQPFSLSSIGGAIGPAGLDFASPTLFADAYQTIVEATQFTATTAESTLVRREVTTAPASATLPGIDFSTALPFISDITFAQPTPARPDISIVLTAPAALKLATADVGIVNVSWFSPGPGVTGTWTFVVPPSTTAFKVPALPADASAFAPTIDSFNVDDAVFYDAPTHPDYKAAKTAPFQPIYGNYLDPTRPLPVAGTLRFTRWLPFAG